MLMPHVIPVDRPYCPACGAHHSTTRLRLGPVWVQTCPNMRPGSFVPVPRT